MSGRMARSCLQSLLKLVNALIGFAGMGMILYSLWMLRAWSQHAQASAFSDSVPPWFIYTFLGLGIIFCTITCSGHVAAETTNGHCLSCYMVFVFFLIIVEAAIAIDVLLNRSWEEDFPEDPTGNLDEFKKFVRSNFEICQWVGLSFVSAQALAIILSMVLRALGPDPGSYYDSDEDMEPTRLPLLRSQSQHASCSYNPDLSPRINDSWNIRIHDKGDAR